MVGLAVALELADTVDTPAAGCPVDESPDIHCTRPAPRQDLNGLIKILINMC